IETATAAAGPWTLTTQTSANVETFTVNGLQSNTAYFFRIRSYNGDGTSAWLETSATTLMITGVENRDISKAVNVYPNPTSTGTFHVEIGDQLGVSEYTLTVLDTKGLTVETFTARNQQEAATFALKNARAGLYILRINMGKNM